MHGPTTALICSRRAPSFSIAAMVASADSAERAAPPGMGGADHAGLSISEQDRRAIGGQYGEQQPGPVGDHGIGVRARVLRPRRKRVDDLGRMDLVDGDQSCAGGDRFRRQAPVLLDRSAVVIAPKSDIEAGKLTRGNAAAPSKEAMGQAAKQRRADDLDAHSKPAGSGHRGR